MTPMLYFWFALSVLCDISGQLLFKTGTSRLPEVAGAPAHASAHAGFVGGLFGEPRVLAGLGVNCVETLIWLHILTDVPLSVAFPVSSANILGTVLASRLILKEQISKMRWLGAGFVTLGIVLLTTSV